MADFKLIFRSGTMAGKEESFSTNELIIGRDPVHPMTIDDVNVSRDHLKIFTENEQLLLQDLESTNGTFINGKRVSKPTRLRSGDLVSLGENNVFEINIFEPDSVKEVEAAQEQAEPVVAIKEDQDTVKPTVKGEKASKSRKAGERPAVKFLASLPTWAVVLFIAVGFFILFCLIPFVVIEVTDQWCNLFSGFFNAISPGICP